MSLGNVLSASYGAGEKPVSFIRDEDQELFKGLKSQVGLNHRSRLVTVAEYLRSCYI